MYCSKCGKENNENCMFCEECGEKLHSTNSIKDTIQKARVTIKKGLDFCKKNGLFFKRLSPKMIGAALVALALAIALCVTILHKSDEDKIIELTNTLAASINEGDYEKMITCFEPATQNQMDALLNAGSLLLGSVDIESIWSIGAVEMSQNAEIYINIYDITVKKNSATADISFSFDEGKDDAIGTVQLVKIKGKWYFKEF